jgi:pyruvate/2-oxoglutarate dehydrogenase complex dihydrolipoamide dehydrogenase (E3) component
MGAHDQTIHADVVILGCGSAGEELVPRLIRGGRRVTVIEQGRVGGSCPYLACMPSKTMLVEAERTTNARPRASGPDPSSFEEAIRRRDEVADHRDDSNAAEKIVREGAELVRGSGELSGHGTVVVGDKEFDHQELVIATGSRPVVPDIPGIQEIDPWTSDDVFSKQELPASLLVMGGSSVGCEIAQIYAAYGCRVTIVEREEQLLPGEEPRVAQLLGSVFDAEGISVVTGTDIQSFRQDGGSVVAVLAGGHHVRADRVVVATGRAPATTGIGLQNIGLEEGTDGIEVDEHCRVLGAEHVWAAGDVTSAGGFTHVAKYQARVIAANLTGKEMVADLRITPRVVYTDPSVASVGRSENEARSAGIEPISSWLDLTDVDRGFTDGLSAGCMGLVADPDAGILVGATIMAPRAEETIGEAALAIGSEIPLQSISQVIHPFPSYGGAFELLCRELAEMIEVRGANRGVEDPEGMRATG